MNKYFSFFLLALISISCSSNQDAISTIENDLLPTFYVEGEKPDPASIMERMQHHKVPGISVAVFRNGTLDWAKGYGVADKESNTPVDPQTLFQAASISKPVTAMAVLDMVEDGTLDLDTDINEYLSSWKLADNEFTVNEKVTLRRILNHSAGTTVWGFPGYSRTGEIPDAVGVVSGKGNTDSIYVYKIPGVSWQYSGGGYTVMQIALSDVEQKPFEDILAERVLKPLEMNTSTYEQPLPESLYDKAATGYRGNGDEVDDKWHVYPEQAAAGLWTTPTDIGKYAIALQNSLSGSENSVLDPETTIEMLTPGDNNHALGPGIRYNGSYFGHGGANEGYRNDFIASMDGGNVVVIMTNSDTGYPLLSELTQAIFRYYGWSGPEPTVITRADLPFEYLNSFAGTYNIPALGNLTLAVEDSSLVIIPGEVVSNQAMLVPVSDSTFFDMSDGTQIQFHIEQGIPSGFEVQGFTGTRIEN